MAKIVHQNTPSIKQLTYMGTYGLAIQDEKVLLVTKSETSVYYGLLDLPGGGIEFGESPEIALLREFKEEVGLKFETMEWMANLAYTAENAPYADGVLSFHHLGLIYAVNNLSELPGITAEDEHAWYSLNEINLENLTPFARQALEHKRI